MREDTPGGPGGGGASATLLLVDDEPLILKSLERLFRPFDYRVLTAEGGREGLGVLEKEPVDVIISDIRMPELSGVEFLAEAAERWPERLRIVLTGEASMDETAEAINRGHLYGYIRKPWEDHDVYLMVRHAIQHLGLERERRRLVDLSARAGRLMDMSGDQFWVFDADTLRFRQVNRSARERLVGEGRLLEDLSPADRLPEIDAAALRERLEPVRKGERPQAALDTVFEAADGRRFPIEARVHFAAQREGPVYFAVVRDVTERRQWEQEARTYMGALEWSNEHLRSIRVDLDARHAEVESHARRIAYGLKEPISEVMGAGRMLRRALDEGLVDRAGESLARIIEAADRMGELMENLLTLNRYGQPAMSRAPVDLNRCVQDALALLRSRDPEAHADVTVEALPAVAGDAPMLVELFRNLIGYVLRFAADRERPRIRVQVVPGTAPQVIAVTGNGGGSGLEVAAAMFRESPLAARGARLTAEAEVGLAICKKVVARHGGTIWVESSPRLGTSIRFTLGETLALGRPLAGPPPSRPAAAPAEFSDASDAPGTVDGRPSGAR
jgi:PAS domain S-box-containing protein